MMLVWWYNSRVKQNACDHLSEPSFILLSFPHSSLWFSVVTETLRPPQGGLRSSDTREYSHIP